MVVIDIIVLIILLLAGLSGFASGFGNVLRKVSNGTVGWIFSVVVCYFLFGLVLALPFVQDLMLEFVEILQDSSSGFTQFLLLIRVDLILVAVVLFLLVTLLRKLVVDAISSLFEVDNGVMNIVNRILGIILSLVWLVMIMLIVFQVMMWISGPNGAVYEALEGSFMGLDSLYLNNPMNDVIDMIEIGL